MPEFTTITHPNPSTTREMLAQLYTEPSAERADIIAANLIAAIDVALEPMGLTLAEVKALNL